MNSIKPEAGTGFPQQISTLLILMQYENASKGAAKGEGD
jgi:hypothetical protein